MYKLAAIMIIIVLTIPVLVIIVPILFVLLCVIFNTPIVPTKTIVSTKTIVPTKTDKKQTLVFPDGTTIIEVPDE